MAALVVDCPMVLATVTAFLLLWLLITTPSRKTNGSLHFIQMFLLYSMLKTSYFFFQLLVCGHVFELQEHLVARAME